MYIHRLASVSFPPPSTTTHTRTILFTGWWRSALWCGYGRWRSSKVYHALPIYTHTDIYVYLYIYIYTYFHAPHPQTIFNNWIPFREEEI